MDTVAHLIGQRVPTIGPATPVPDVERLFLDDPLVRCVVVDRDGEFDLVERHDFFTFLAGPLGYGRAVHERRTISSYPAPPALVVRGETTLADASRQAVSRGDVRWSHTLVVETPDGFGGVDMATVLRAVTVDLEQQIGVDQLTGLANRRGFLRTVRAEFEGARRRTGLLVLVDLDGFKGVNDALGHRVGDEVLRETGRRIRRRLPTAVAARMGGDEFAVFLADHTAESAHDIGLTLTSDLRAPVMVDGLTANISASVGIAAISERDDVMESLHHADLALYRAKGAEKNTWRVFDVDVHHDAQRVRTIVDELRTAIEQRRVHLQFQPVIDLQDESVVAYEALARWRSDRLGPIAPAEFIGIAERTGLIVPLGRHLLERSIVEASSATWPADANVHVNMSRRELQQPDLSREIAGLLDTHGLDARRLVVEVTETAAEVDTLRMIETLSGLSSLGVRVALDDFGVGVTSLSNLANYPLNIVKLDRSLVTALDPEVGHPRSSDRVRAIVELCHAHGLTVTAEGVETREQADSLRSLGCDFAQGYLFGRPAGSPRTPAEDTTSTGPRHTARA